jgi:hypothetical protein
MNAVIKIKLACVFLCSMTGISEITAQVDTLKNYTLGMFITMPIEFPVIDNSFINESLAGAGFPALKYPAANIGIGLQYHLNRFILTFSYNKTTQGKDYDRFLTEVEYRSTSINFGYDFIKKISWSLYPYVGFKGCGVNYLYREKISDEISMNDYLKMDLTYKEFTNSRAHLDIGTGISFQWFFLINCRFGYLLPLERIRWEMNNSQTKLINAPKINYNYYFTITLGIGGIATHSQLINYYSRR